MIVVSSAWRRFAWPWHTVTWFIGALIIGSLLYGRGSDGFADSISLLGMLLGVFGPGVGDVQGG